MRTFAVKLNGLLQDVIKNKVLDEVPIFYYDNVMNVGDLVGPYLAKKITKKDVFKPKTKRLFTIYSVGSIMHGIHKKSYVWGCGIISPDLIPHKHQVDERKVFAVRGCKTKKLLEEKYGMKLNNISIGDPAVLMPMFYTPIVKERSNKIGLVVHYIEEAIVKSMLSSNKSLIEKCKIISVKQEPEEFINELSSCDYVISSSLHGLILADSYGIKNKWISFSDKITGGEFKFQDYYSTTSSGNGVCIKINNALELIEVFNNIPDFAKVNNYKFSREDLVNSFPLNFMKKGTNDE